MINSICTPPFKVVLGISFLLLLFNSCGNASDNEAIQIIEESNPNLISLTAEQFNSSEMATGKMEIANFSEIVRTNGIFDVPPSSKSSVSAYFGGYVNELELLPGEKITKGQLLFTLENPDYIQTQREFLEIQGHLSFLKSDYERQKRLASENITSTKKYLQAETDYNVAKAQYASLKKILGLMNIDSDKVSTESLTTVIRVKAPISGFITSVNASKGMFLNPSDIAVTITDTDHLHIELNVFEKDLRKLKVNQQVRFKLQNDTNNEYMASVSLINKQIDSETRSVMVHCHLNNELDAVNFVPGMFVEAEVLTTTEALPSLPQEAVVEIENVYYVLLKSNGAGMNFERKEVKIGKTENGRVAILNASRFPSSAEFLTKGAFNMIIE
jgi:cobalt-zinc-cadmium efflux system membrane fusion protein